VNKIFTEETLSGINSKLSLLSDTTSFSVYSGDISSGVTKTGTSYDLGMYSKNTVYVDVTSTTVNAASTGITLFAYSRATSTKPWVLFLTNSNLASSTYMFKLAGSGGTSSGVDYFKHVRISLQNVSTSGTAVVNVELFSKSQL